MEFEWDERKTAENLRKHSASFNEAATIFDDPLAYTFNDPDNSVGETRLLTFGNSHSDRLLVVSHVERNGHIRIISAREVSKHERQIYEKG
jgi:hypothetical protein